MKDFSIKMQEKMIAHDTRKANLQVNLFRSPAWQFVIQALCKQFYMRAGDTQKALRARVSIRRRLGEKIRFLRFLRSS